MKSLGLQRFRITTITATTRRSGSYLLPKRTRYGLDASPDLNPGVLVSTRNALMPSTPRPRRSARTAAPNAPRFRSMKHFSPLMT